ncbi:MAG TPA: prepilin-type N-terminal cleavage/methylation domain-containing protein [Pirellulales bacterium]|jgi:prepilin-type N-terminal cleavage/methylation domain-containing protein|nr:prepilin-type N-terminal cleavage/methylation domain-containing protein [Pirellulales bacterium]
MTGRLADHHRAGFTLVEMLIVLALLAMITTIAVQSMGPLADQGRYDTTMRTLGAVKAAILTSNNVGSADAAPSVTGYIADTGLLPRLQYDATTGSIVNDLLVLPSDLNVPAYGNQAAGGVVPVPFPQLGQTYSATNSCPTVSYSWGWRGPYVEFSTGSVVSGACVSDAWGTPIQTQAIAATSSPMLIGSQTFSSLPFGALAIVSEGNAALTSAAHAADVFGSTCDIAETLNAWNWCGTITGTLYTQSAQGTNSPPAAGAYYQVVLFGPGPSGVTAYYAALADTTTQLSPSYPNTTVESDATTLAYYFDSSVSSDPTAEPLACVNPWAGRHVLYVQSSTSQSGPFYPVGQAVFVNVLPATSLQIDLRLQ